jgi:hypothetical protein
MTEVTSAERILVSPRQGLDDNLRPAELLLRVYRLMECEGIRSEGTLLTSLRGVVGAGDSEELLLIYNEIFIGLIRERAQLPATALKKSALKNLLRQSVVVACTALDAYLPSLLRVNLPIVIQIKGRDFFPQDASLQDYFKELTFDLSETLRLIADPNAPLFIANKILSLMSFKYLSSKKGVHVVGALLGLEKPWEEIASTLQREKKDLTNTIEETAKRRNDIVHRADRPQSDPTSEIQDITYAWATHAVDAVKHVCLALDELIAKRINELKAQE